MRMRRHHISIGLVTVQKLDHYTRTLTLVNQSATIYSYSNHIFAIQIQMTSRRRSIIGIVGILF